MWQQVTKCRSRLAEGFVQFPHSILAYLLHKMRVGVHRLRDRGVSHQGLNLLRVHVPIAQRRGERVAQAMEGKALIVQPGPSQQRFILAIVEVIVVRWLTEPVGEHEIVGLPTEVQLALLCSAALDAL